MASRAFFIEWVDIAWTMVISYTLTQFSADDEPKSAVNYVYFCFIAIELCAWMLPMMISPKWGTQEYAKTVTLHLLILDLATDIPVIITVFVEEAYQDNPLLFIDMIWKSTLLIRSISYYLVNQVLYKAKRLEDDDDDQSTEPWIPDRFRIPAKSTLIWIYFVYTYWTIFTLYSLISTNTIATNFEYYTWFFGMIGVTCVHDTYAAGYSALTKRGRSMMAFACTFICTDMMIHSFVGLSVAEAPPWAVFVKLVFMAISVLWALLFFYDYALEAGRTGGVLNKAWLSLLTEWIDILLMYMAIFILHGQLGACFGAAICVTYFVVASIKLYLWFFPIMFGYSDTEWYIHVHMLILDSLTDLPLVITIIATEGYLIHWFLFVDISYKIIMLLKCYAYHGLINLVLRKVELDQKHKEQLRGADKIEDGDDDTEIEQ